MSDYGFRISADGIDVKTGADKDMVVTSKYSMLKGSLSGSGTTSVPQTGSTTTITIAHGLSYQPMAQAYATDVNGDYFVVGIYYPMPVYLFAAAEIAWSIRADSTNVYLDFYYDDFGGGGSNVSIAYSYYIYLDKGKL